MASGPAKPTEVNDWQPVEANDWQDVNATPAPAAAPDERNGLQRAFDTLTTVTPEEDANQPAPLRALNHFGAGTLQTFSPIFHPIKTLEGIGDTIAHPEDAAKSVWESVKNDPAEALGNLVGGAVTGGVAAEAGEPLLAKIPSKARAGATFESVMNDAADQPVNMTRSMDPLERIQQLSERGGTGVKAADQLYKRINTVNPLNYREARDFASNISRLSAAEKMGLSPTMKAEIGKLSKAFNQDIGDTAASVGRGEDYANAMREYARGARLSNFLDNAKKAAIPIAAGAAGVGGLHRLLRAFE